MELRAPRAGDYGWIVERHGALYSQEYGWGVPFEAIVARIVADFASAHSERERCWIAELDGKRAGCVLVVETGDDPRVAQLRVLLVEPWARGHGMGDALVRAAIEFSRAAGYGRLVLWTNAQLHAARRIYERAGFTLVEETPDESYHPGQVAQVWSLAL
jgi:GNAT superfamily N-acetyltransferase